MDVSENRRTLGNGLYGIVFVVEKIQNNGFFLDVFHYDVVDANVFDHSATTASGFDTDSSVCSVENAVGNGDFFDST
ncbi:hypothetical protein D3C84_1134440 [compost metagenome]